MAQQDVRLLGGALSLHRFTFEELALAAGVNFNTARAWVRRNRSHFFAEGSIAAGARGRPRRVWRIADGATEVLRRRLEEFDLERLAGQMAKASPPKLDGLQGQFEAWSLAKRLAYGTEPAEHRALKQMIRQAWEDMSAVFGLTGDVHANHSKTVAELEFNAGAGVIPESEDLRKVAVWLTVDVDRMQARDIAAKFAAHVIRQRADVRGDAYQVKITNAALAASVWADEGLIEEGAASEGIKSCAQIAELAGVGAVIDQVSKAIGVGRFCFCRDPDEGQAVLSGLTARTTFKRAEDVQRWLVALRAATYWKPEFAPVALHGAWEGRDMHQETLIDVLGNDVRRALDRPPKRIGKLRRKALIFAKWAVERPTSEPLSIVEGAGGAHEAFNVEDLLSVYTYRPTQEASRADL
jgi:hypothetical protein